jgi:hypothetical protein
MGEIELIPALQKGKAWTMPSLFRRLLYLSPDAVTAQQLANYVLEYVEQQQESMPAGTMPYGGAGPREF